MLTSRFMLMCNKQSEFIVHSWNAHTDNYMPKEVSYLRICLKLVICINMNLIVGDIVNPLYPNDDYSRHEYRYR